MLAQITDALRRGETAAALAAARSFATDEPQNAAARHLLGVCLQRVGDLAGARAAFEAAIEAAPDRAEYYFSLATLVLAEGDKPAAIRRLHEALALDPNQLGAYVMLMHLALGRGDQAEAQRNLKLAQRVDEEHPQVKVAEGYLLQAQNDPDGALRAFTDAVTKAPTLAAAQLALGMAYLGRGMWPFAEQALSNALALDPSRPPATLRALIEARRRQGNAAGTLAALGELIALQPDDLFARGLRAEILTSGDDAGAALPDLEYLLDKRPGHPHTVTMATSLLARLGRGQDAVQRAEAALAQFPENADLWRARLNVSGLLGEDAKPLLDRWQEAVPDSADALDLLAGYHQARGETALAESYADRALALRPDLATSTSVKLREEVAADPEAALARVQRLLPGTSDPALRRTLLGWGGAALDALGRSGEAAALWRQMLGTMLPPGQIAPPPPVPAEAAPAGEGAGTLLFSPPGVRSEYVRRAVKATLGARLRPDRFGTATADDGFGSKRFPPGHAEAGTARRWRDSLQAAGLDPATVVDWLPFVDGYTLEALRGARVIALLTDPRDALLNWMVHGSAQNYLFSNAPANSAAWLAATLGMLADHRDRDPDRVHLVHLDSPAGDAAATLQALLDLPQPLPASGSGARFPAGHWRRYREAFAEEFALLAPVAVRLGYPKD